MSIYTFVLDHGIEHGREVVDMTKLQVGGTVYFHSREEAVRAAERAHFRVADDGAVSWGDPLS